MSTTLVDVLRARAEESADELAFLFLIDGETEGPRYNYAQLDAQARAIAVALRRVTGEQERGTAASIRRASTSSRPSSAACMPASWPCRCIRRGPTSCGRGPSRWRPSRPIASRRSSSARARCWPSCDRLWHGSPRLAQAHAIATDELDAGPRSVLAGPAHRR